MSGVDIEGVLDWHHHWTIVGAVSDEVDGYCANQQGAHCGWTGSKSEWRAHVAAVLREQIAAWLAPVHALADQWNETPDYTPSAYDQGRVDQRHDMTTQLFEVLAALVAPSREEPS